MLKKFLLIGTAAVALGAVSLQARADNIVTNQWYSGGFTGTPSPLVGPFATGTNGPVLPNPTKANALPTPTSGGVLTAIITLPHGGKLLVTDVEASGDQFEMFVNGAPAISAPGGSTGLIPGGQQSSGAFTSAPNFGDACVEDISCALSDANFSSGTFNLPAGIDTITGTFIGSVGFGDMNYIVETVPEPASLSILGLGLAGLGLMARRRRA